MKEKAPWFKTLWIQKPLWAIGLFILPLAAIVYWIYTLGKNKGLNTPPDDAPSPEYIPPTQQEKALFEQWSKTHGKLLVEQAHNYFSAWYAKIWYGQMRELCHELKVLSDKELIWIANDYNRKYYKDGTFLTQIIAHKLYATAAYDSLLARLVKLKAK